MKKILGITLLIISMLFSNVYASELPTITIGSSNASIGDEITIPVTLENNKDGFACIGLKISYNSRSLEYVSAKIKGLKDAQMKDISNTNDIVFLYALVYDDDKILKDNGVIAEIKFKVKDEAITSDLKVVQLDYGDKELNRLEHKTNDGKVKILEKGKISSTKDLSNLIENKDNKKIKWKSSDNKVATVDKDGKVTFKKDGNAVITAVDEDGNILLEKEYNVSNKNKDNSKSKKISIVSIIVFIVLTLASITAIFIFRKKKNKKI